MPVKRSAYLQEGKFSYNVFGLFNFHKFMYICTHTHTHRYMEGEGSHMDELYMMFTLATFHHQLAKAKYSLQLPQSPLMIDLYILPSHPHPIHSSAIFLCSLISLMHCVQIYFSASIILSNENKILSSIVQKNLDYTTDWGILMTNHFKM